MLSGLGAEGRVLWPLAVQHACWSLREGARPSRRRVPTFGDTVTCRVKKSPNSDWEPRGVERVFLGVLGDVAHGTPTGTFDGEDWHLEMYSNYVIPGALAAEGAPE